MTIQFYRNAAKSLGVTWRYLLKGGVPHTLTIEYIDSVLLAHFKKHGKVPARGSKERISDNDSRMWHSVNSMMWMKLGTSLKERAIALGLIEDSPRRYSWTKQKLERFVRQYRRKYGRWPHSQSGKIQKGLTWRQAENWLRTERVGIGGLKPFCQRIGKAPDFSMPYVRRLCREHKHRTGKWPTSNAGQIHGEHRQWSSVYAWLARNGSSLKALRSSA